MHAHGSPQLFQTGESYQRQPLLNYQHPHDLVMELGATYERPLGRVRAPRRRGLRGFANARADPVHAPRVGPQQSSSAAHPSLHGFDAHHARAWFAEASQSAP